MKTGRKIKSLRETCFPQRFYAKSSFRLYGLERDGEGEGAGTGGGKPSLRRKVGRPGVSFDGRPVLSGVVVCVSSGAGCLRRKVGRPGVVSLSVVPPIAPEVVARAFDILKRRALTR